MLRHVEKPTARRKSVWWSFINETRSSAIDALAL